MTAINSVGPTPLPYASPDVAQAKSARLVSLDEARTNDGEDPGSIRRPPATRAAPTISIAVRRARETRPAAVLATAGK